MNQQKLSDFIYTIDLENDEGAWGVWNFKQFFTRSEALDYAESMAKNNPQFSVTIGVRPRFRRRNVLQAGGER